jgi:hypothetical protein
MALLWIVQHTNWLALNHEGMVRDSHDISTIPGPWGVFLLWRFRMHFAPNVCQPWSGYGRRAKRRGIIACSSGN